MEDTIYIKDDKVQFVKSKGLISNLTELNPHECVVPKEYSTKINTVIRKAFKDGIIKYTDNNGSLIVTDEYITLKEFDLSIYSEEQLLQLREALNSLKKIEKKYIDEHRWSSLHEKLLKVRDKFNKIGIDLKYHEMTMDIFYIRYDEYTIGQYIEMIANKFVKDVDSDFDDMGWYDFDTFGDSSIFFDIFNSIDRFQKEISKAISDKYF